MQCVRLCESPEAAGATVPALLAGHRPVDGVAGQNPGQPGRQTGDPQPPPRRPGRARPIANRPPANRAGPGRDRPVVGNAKRGNVPLAGLRIQHRGK